MTTPSLPEFRYHPDPLATGAFKPSDEPCACCNQVRGYLYGYLAGDVCPWCIASGEAHDKLGFESVAADFVGASWHDGLQQAGYPEWDAVPQRVAREVAHRTPGFSSHQDPWWWSHCNDAGAFIGFVGDLPRELFDGLLAERFVEEVKRAEDLTDEDWEWHVSTPDALHHMSIYVFRCLHCRRLGGYADCS